MDLVYTLTVYGVGALMIFFIATITAGIILGTFLMLVDLAHRVRGARQATPVTALSQPEQGSTGVPA